MAINTNSPATFTTSILIGDPVATPNSSADSIPLLTRQNGMPVSAALEIQSIDSALLFPRMTTAQRDAMPNPADGMMIYNTTAATFNIRIAGNWTPIGGGGGDVVGPGVSILDDIAIFADTTGKVLADSGVSITQVPHLLTSNKVKHLGLPLTIGTQIGKLNNIQFINDIGLIFVDSLLPVEFITNDYGPGSQTCSLFTGDLPSSSTTPSALVEIQSTTGALLISRMTTAQQNALTFPAAGMMIYNTDTGTFNFYNGSAWITFESSSSAAPSNATYILQTANGSLTNAQVLASLTTGLLKNTTGTGVLSIAIPGTDYGTVTSVSGTAGQIDVATGTTTPVISIDSGYVGQTSITTLGTITTGTWHGSIIDLAHGGTNANLTASNGGIFYSTASAGAILAGTASANQVLLSGASTTPAWSTAIYPATTTINQLLYSSSSNTITGLTTANSAVLVTSSTGVPVFSSTLTNGQIIIGSTGATPTAGTLTAGSGVTITNAGGSITIAASGSGGTVTSVSGTALQIDVSNPTTTPVISIDSGYVGQTSITTLGTITTGTWHGSLIPLAYGGTNANLTASNGGIFYSTASAGAVLAGTATANQVLLSGSSTTPAWSTATYPATTTINQLLYSSAANTITGLATANSAVLVTNSTGVPVFSSTLTNGQIIIGSTGATPTAATLSAGTGISIANAGGSITISNTGAGFTWTNVTGGTQALVAQNGYITDNSGGVTYTLPASGSLGDEIVIVGKLGISTIDQNANQQILIAGSSSTVGVGGSVNGNNVGDCITIICITSGASTVWRANSVIGNWTIT